MKDGQLFRVAKHLLKKIEYYSKYGINYTIETDDIIALKNAIEEQESITDADIETWALRKALDDLQPRRYVSASRKAFHSGLIQGAKAMRDNEIKHIK